ncbi:MAG TPA: LLM class flavin-dependent oxidoreductase [Oligoflexus sp.]|uniref:LLM class flavin-dependent oxidoreductase n=1 Tax=Oligoflexus sp. TaxID=1971216 RepID=UPI002D7EDDE6|nr:LLM class flavin-dependent oxidoreductase [Oligoflexus sp.]HET9239621.1 LLM class flavin-dependent oxidoreductase [Oligoflexus sp.]
MKFDIFFSICQTEIDGVMPSEKVMFQQFFDQLKLADELGFETAWVAETHLSCETQKCNPDAVIPHFKGEIGLNTDILQLAHKAFGMTKRIHIGSAIRNILCNGGPLAHAEAVKTFFTLHTLDPDEKRKLFLGFAAGRFPFSNKPYGIKPRNELEAAAWPVIKGLIFNQATEIFLRSLKNEVFSSQDLAPQILPGKNVAIPPFWEFDKVGVIPFEAPLDLLQLVVGSHDPEVQILANRYFPSWVFNLSITPTTTIEATHQRMAQHYHPAGGAWHRSYMPRTSLIFLNGDAHLSPEQQRAKARASAQSALENYWRAMEGTLDPRKVAEAVENAVYGNPQDVANQLKAKYHPDDRLMLWFDFNNHDNAAIKASMEAFWNQTRPLLTRDGQ